MPDTPIEVYYRFTNSPGETGYPVSRRPSIALIDVSNGYITRYFIQDVATKKVIEVDNKQYNTFQNLSRFNCIKLKWNIIGTDKDVTRQLTGTGETIIIHSTRSRNEATAIFFNSTMPGLKHILHDSLEFFVGERISK